MNHSVNFEAGPSYSSFFDTQYMYQHQSTLPSPPTSPQFSWQVTTVDEDAHTHTYNDKIPSAKARRTQIPAETMSSLMTGPDPVDGKYVCLYGGCMRRFGRKYNIQSHIQTHLADRPFRCNVCAAGFVRRHDLVRHARIHGTGKDFVCGCGKGFSRMDALNRHRQRQICVGGADKSQISISRKKTSVMRSQTASSVESDAGVSSGASSRSDSHSPDPESFRFERMTMPGPHGQMSYPAMIQQQQPSFSMPRYYDEEKPSVYDQASDAQHHGRIRMQKPQGLQLQQGFQYVQPVPRHAVRIPLTSGTVLDQEMWVNPSLISPAMTSSSHFHSDNDEGQYYY